MRIFKISFRRIFLWIATAACISFLSAGTVLAADLTVFSAGAVSAVMSQLADDFRTKTGHTISFTVGTVGQLKEKIEGGATADIVFVTPDTMEALVKQGKVISDTVVEVGKVGVGVAVREGTPLPDISNEDAFRQVLLNAKSLVYADPAKGASSGIYFATVLQRLGIADEIKDKTTLLPGGFVLNLVAEGKAEIGVQQITEIIPVKGVALVGPLPPGLQKITTYSGAIMTANVNAGVAAEFLRFVTSKEAAPRFKAAGFGIF
ncbi:MAG: substrate-binding domain-containing protein [Negativicutes bacterium]|nr:substrate-binding domain-containing protein [Negativicutes bacterium]